MVEAEDGYYRGPHTHYPPPPDSEYWYDDGAPPPDFFDDDGGGGGGGRAFIHHHGGHGGESPGGYYRGGGEETPVRGGRAAWRVGHEAAPWSSGKKRRFGGGVGGSGGYKRKVKDGPLVNLLRRVRNGQDGEASRCVGFGPVWFVCERPGWCHQ